MPRWFRIVLAVLGALFVLYGLLWLAVLDFNVRTGSYSYLGYPTVQQATEHVLKSEPQPRLLVLGFGLLAAAILWPRRRHARRPEVTS